MYRRASLPLLLVGLVHQAALAQEVERLPDTVAAAVESSALRARNPALDGLARAATVAGRVVDVRDGRPLSGVRVHAAAGGSTVTDASGAYVLGAGLFRDRVVLSALAPGFRLQRTTAGGLLPGDRRDGVDLALAPAPRLRGTVLEAGSRVPVPSARLVLRRLPRHVSLGRAEPRDPASVEALGDAAGRFELESLAPVVELHVEADGYEAASWRLELPLERDLDGVELTLRRGGAPVGAQAPGGGVAGVVVFERGGRPVPGAAVIALPSCLGPELDGGWSLPRAVASVEPDGSFLLESLPAGLYDLAVSSPHVAGASCYRTVRQGVIVEPYGLAAVEPIRVGRALHVSGRVVDQRGEAVQDAFVQAEPLDPARAPPPNTWSSAHSTRTRADGRYDIGSLEPGAYRIVAHLLEFDLAVHREVRVPAEDVDFTVSAAGALRGRVLRAEDGSAVPSFEVAVRVPPAARRFPHSENDAPRPFFAPDGRFELTGLPDGVYDVEVSAHGLLPVRLEGVRLEAGRTPSELVARLVAGASLDGVVLDEAAAPVAGARVWKGQVDFDEPAADTYGLPEPEAITGSDGRFRFERLAAGHLSLQVRHEAFAPFREQTELAAREARTEVELRLVRGHRVRGRLVAGAARGSAAGVQVLLDPVHFGFGGRLMGQASTTTAADGSFELQHVHSGVHTLAAAGTGSAKWSLVEIDVHADVDGIEHELDVPLGLRGVVLDPDGLPVAGAEVELHALARDAPPGRARTDEAGRFQLDWPPGRSPMLLLSAQASGPRGPLHATKTLTPLPRSALRLSLRLQ